jgi:LPS sulfotransferase NodH
VFTPERSYVVCGTQRSGTTLLCWALADTDRLGRPGEYFIDGDPSQFSPGWKFWEEGPIAQERGVTTRAEFVELVYRLGTTDNGVFGIKLMWNNVPWVTRRLQSLPQFGGLATATLLPAVFPGLQVVQITRRDRVGQAISWAKAAQDGVWVVTDGTPATPTGKPVYDFGFINGLERLIVEGENGWRNLFRELELKPYEVVYEDLADPEGYEAAILGVAAHLGVELADVRMPQPRSHRQADHLNEEWRQRYLEDLVKTRGCEGRRA